MSSIVVTVIDRMLLDSSAKVEVVKPRRVILAVLGSMSEIPTYCFFIQFSGLEDVFQMLGDRAVALVKEHANRLLRQPDGFLCHSDLDAVFVRLPGKYQELGGAVADLEFVFSLFMACSYG